MARALSCLAVAGISAVLLALATPAPADTHIRPQFSAAASMPAHWGVIDHGKSLGLAIELEHGARWSQIAEFDVHWLDAGRGNSWSSSFVGEPFWTTPASWSQATLLNGRFGVRFHMARTTRVRPYLQAGVGVRKAIGADPVYVLPASASDEPKSGSHVDGATMHVRFGVTTAAYRGAGLFLDGSAEALFSNPRDYALFPVRLGIIIS
jgi:hypothetical protein